MARKSSDQNGRNSNKIPRRNWLKSVGVVGAGIGLAGCTGDDETPTSGDGDGGDGGGDGDGGDGGDGGGDGDGGDGGTERVFTLNNRGTGSFTQEHWNKYNPNQSVTRNNRAGNIVFDRWWWYLPTSNTQVSRLVTDMTKDGTTLELELRDDATWHDGDDVTAGDAATQFKLDIFAAGGDHEFFDSVDGIEAVDDKLVRAELREPYAWAYLNPSLGLNNYNGRLKVKESVFGDLLSDLEDAGGETPPDDALNNLIDFRWEMDDVVGNGPMKVDDWSETSLMLSKYEDYYNADNIKVSKMEYTNLKEWEEALIQGRIDAVPTNFPVRQSLMDRMPDDLQTEPMISGSRDYVFGFNLRPQVPTSNRKVRQAIAFAVDGRQIAQVSGPGVRYHDFPSTGLSPALMNRYIGDQLDDYITYEQDRQRARNLMQEAGWEKNSDGKWTKPNGEVWELVLFGIVNNPLQPLGESTRDQLRDFGFEVNFRTMDLATWNERRMEGEHDITPQQQGQGGYYLNNGKFYFGMANLGGMDITQVETPMPIGDPEGDVETINLDEEIQKLFTAQTPQVVKEQNRLLSWVWNVNCLFYIPVWRLERPGMRTNEYRLTDEILDRKDMIQIHSPAFVGIMREGGIVPK